jgi:hypothetical protein
MIRFNTNARLNELMAKKSDAMTVFTNAKIAHSKAVAALPETAALAEAQIKFNKASVEMLNYHKKLNPET